MFLNAIFYHFKILGAFKHLSNHHNVSVSQKNVTPNVEHIDVLTSPFGY